MTESLNRPSIPLTQSAVFRSAYRRSWVDHLIDWIEQLPGPSWLFYVGLWAVLVIVEWAIQTAGGKGGLPAPFNLVFLGSAPFTLAMIHLTDRLAGQALTRFRPTLDCTEVEYATAYFRITNMPMLPVMVASIVGIAISVALLVFVPLSFRVQLSNFVDTPLSIAFNYLVSLILFIMASIGIYHIRHHYETIRQLLHLYTNVNLFNLGPIYAFSNVSAVTAIALVVISYSWFMTAPDLLSQPATVPFFVGYFIVAVLVFLLPLLEVHGLLADEKERLLTETSARLQALTDELFRRVDSGEITDMDNLNKAMATIELEYQVLKRVPTWPWQPEILRAVIIAVLFPLVVWLLQSVLQRFLTP